MTEQPQFRKCEIKQMKNILEQEFKRRNPLISPPETPSDVYFSLTIEIGVLRRCELPIRPFDQNIP